MSQFSSQNGNNPPIGDVTDGIKGDAIVGPASVTPPRSLLSPRCRGSVADSAEDGLNHSGSLQPRRPGPFRLPPFRLPHGLFTFTNGAIGIYKWRSSSCGFVTPTKISYKSFCRIIIIIKIFMLFIS